MNGETHSSICGHKFLPSSGFCNNVAMNVCIQIFVQIPAFFGYLSRRGDAGSPYNEKINKCQELHPKNQKSNKQHYFPHLTRDMWFYFRC